ncbi:inositol monophosphatase family protein [Mariniblastus fucicola]|uniref:3'(2'),5'-bisphosphate nucleotidase n=1 Tax=Mariniblastus fucicola TaxID=980251 RepID=A0A5B9PFE9_9BACT|nr:inositol monophosphatase family protein [Mariniblastus fucicola]QEG23910.1 Histidinol-phosphatase [Mariniblastus fucicola]
MSQSESTQRYELAQQIAKSAGKVTLNWFQTDRFEVEKKADRSPLTIADRESEKHLREQIAKHFPDDSIVGEEFGVTEGSSPWRWILDPIDGTKSFISGVPLYGTMVAVDRAIEGSDDRECLIGSVYLPGLDEGIHAMKGQGAWHFRGTETPTKASVSTTTEIADAVMATSQAETFGEVGAADAWNRLAKEVYFCRTWGDVYGYLLLATGRIEVMTDAILNIWDAAAVMPIVEEAGGVFTDFRGERKIDSGNAMASNGPFHDRLLEIVGAKTE